MRRVIAPLAAAAIAVTLAAGPAWPLADGVLGYFQNKAGSAFSADRGKALFQARHGSGKPDTPSCTSCHGSSPQKTGKTRAGKEILPMAFSREHDRWPALKSGVQVQLPETG